MEVKRGRAAVLHWRRHRKLFKIILDQLLMCGVSHVVQPLAPLKSEQDGLLPESARALRGGYSQPERQATEDT